MPLTDEEIAEDDTDFHVKIAVRVNPPADHDFPEFFVKQMEKQLSIESFVFAGCHPILGLEI